MSRLLSVRETAVLKVLAAAGSTGVTDDALAACVQATVAGVRRTVGSLRRKMLATAMDAGGPVRYRITDTGRRALTGDQAGRWVAR